VHVDYQDIDGEHHLKWFSGITAFCIQHELDHLDGKVFIDNYSPLKNKRARVKINKTVRKFGSDILKQKVY
jgi:peptide deformylase